MKLRKKMDSNPTGNIEKEIDELCQGLALLNIQYNRHIIQRFSRYIEILYEYKGKLHLLSHHDYNCISTRHFLTSLMALPHTDDHQCACDIGAGAGFPSMPLKILRPGIKLTLFESNKRKAGFLKYLIERLDLAGVEIVNTRAEDYREQKFDLILLKAVGKIKKLAEIIDGLIEPGGRAIFYKSHRVEDEIREAHKELEKRKFQITVKKLFTPIEHLPLALVMLSK